MRIGKWDSRFIRCNTVLEFLSVPNQAIIYCNHILEFLRFADLFTSEVLLPHQFMGLLISFILKRITIKLIILKNVPPMLYACKATILWYFLRMKVELRPAWVWYCHNCGAENISAWIILEVEEGHHDLSPYEVTCPHCNTTYETEMYDEET